MAKPPRTFDVFISHRDVDMGLKEKFVPRLKRALESRGLSVWLDKDQLKPGDSWGQQIQEAMEASRNIVLILGARSDFDSRSQARPEEALALETFWNDPTKRIILLSFGGARPPRDLASFASIEVGDTPKEQEKAVQMVIETIETPAPPVGKQPEATRKMKAERENRLLFIEKAAHLLR